MIRIAFFFFFFLPNALNSQITEKILFKDLNKEMKCSLVTKDFYHINGLEKKVPIGDTIQLGCSSFEKTGLPISFMIYMRERKGKNKLKLHLYAVKRINFIEDEKIINALDYYCHYGQSNYYFLSNDYIFFTYSIGGDALLHKDAERMAKFEMQFVKNINLLSRD